MTDKNYAIIKFHLLTPFYFPQRTLRRQAILDLFKKEKVRLKALDYIFCTDEYLLRINQDFLKHDDLTDIITFDLSETKDSITGEIYISIDRVRENAAKFGVSLQTELLRVMFHGALHLCEYRDKKPKDVAMMRSKEDFYLTRFTKSQ